jgi:dTMP kinase
MTSASWSTALRGRFLAFEGPDGSGKSTQIGRFQAWAEAQQLPLTLVREPGGTAVGERVRQILLDPIHSEMTVRCEMLLYMASRAQLMEERIEPAIASRACVLSDRFVGSTLAYQGAAGGIPERDIRAGCHLTHLDGVEPTLGRELECGVEDPAAAGGLGLGERVVGEVRHSDLPMPPPDRPPPQGTRSQTGRPAPGRAP